MDKTIVAEKDTAAVAHFFNAAAMAVEIVAAVAHSMATATDKRTRKF